MRGTDPILNKLKIMNIQMEQLNKEFGILKKWENKVGAVQQMELLARPKA